MATDTTDTLEDGDAVQAGTPERPAPPWEGGLASDDGPSSVGFAVLGGSFAEGIDLAGQRLIGAFIATLGLPEVRGLLPAWWRSRQ